MGMQSGQPATDPTVQPAAAPDTGTPPSAGSLAFLADERGILLRQKTSWANGLAESAAYANKYAVKVRSGRPASCLAVFPLCSERS